MSFNLCHIKYAHFLSDLFIEYVTSKSTLRLHMVQHYILQSQVWTFKTTTKYVLGFTLYNKEGTGTAPPDHSHLSFILQFYLVKSWLRWSGQWWLYLVEVLLHVVDVLLHFVSILLQLLDQSSQLCGWSTVRETHTSFITRLCLSSDDHKVHGELSMSISTTEFIRIMATSWGMTLV